MLLGQWVVDNGPELLVIARDDELPAGAEQGHRRCERLWLERLPRLVDQHDVKVASWQLRVGVVCQLARHSERRHHYLRPHNLFDGQLGEGALDVVPVSEGKQPGRNLVAAAREGHQSQQQQLRGKLAGEALAQHVGGGVGRRAR